MTTLYIVLMGMVAFTPSPDGKEMWIFLPNAIGPQSSSDNQVIHSHETCLLYRLGDAGSSSANFEYLDCFARLGLEAGAAGGEVGTWPLAYEDLSINTLKGALTYEGKTWCYSDGDGPPRAKKPTAASASAFCWVPRLTDIAPGNAAMQPDLLPDEKIRIPSPVRVRLRIGSGTFSTYHFSGGKDSEFGGGHAGDPTAAVFGFRPVRAPTFAVKHEQALADAVLIKAQVEGDMVEFVAEKFGGGTRRLQLKGADVAGGKKEVWVALFNVMKKLDSEHPSMLGEQMRHFEMYYRLSEKTPGDTMRTVPEVVDEVVDEVDTERPAAAVPVGAPRWLVEFLGGIQRPICSLVRFTAP